MREMASAVTTPISRFAHSDASHTPRRTCKVPRATAGASKRAALVELKVLGDVALLLGSRLLGLALLLLRAQPKHSATRSVNDMSDGKKAQTFEMMAAFMSPESSFSSSELSSTFESCQSASTAVKGHSTSSKPGRTQRALRYLIVGRDGHDQVILDRMLGLPHDHSHGAPDALSTSFQPTIRRVIVSTLKRRGQCSRFHIYSQSSASLSI